MRRVAFAVYPGFEILDVSGPSAAFNSANRALAAASKKRVYEIDVLSGAGGPVTSSSGIVVETRRIDEHAGHSIDTLLVAGAEQEPLLQAIADRAMRNALPQLAGDARRFGSVCSGAFFLAALGLLDGHRIATHWDACTSLAQAFPSVSVDPDALYVVDGRLWTSAGVTTGIDMAFGHDHR